MQKQLSDGAKQDLAFALVLLKDFKSQGADDVFDVDLFRYIRGLADFLEVTLEFDMMLTKVPPMKIEEKYKC